MKNKDVFFQGSGFISRIRMYARQGIGEDMRSEFLHYFFLRGVDIRRGEFFGESVEEGYAKQGNRSLF